MCCKCGKVSAVVKLCCEISIQSHFVGRSPHFLIGSFVSSYERRRREEEPSAHSVEEMFTMAGGTFGLNESPSVEGQERENVVIPWLGQEGPLKKAAPTHCDD